VNAAACLLFALARGAGDPTPPPAQPVVILSDTGQKRDGLPILVRHPDSDRYVAALSRGYARRLARLYAMAQRFARPGAPIQPAYLALTDNEGGFPRRGFFLDRSRPDAAYVDLHRGGTLSGRPGAIDQIFPHELLHVIVGDLAGEAPEGQATQVHAVGVCTDRITAFNEGFAEHGQVMAIDDPDALPETRAMASDEAMRRWAVDQMESYRTAVSARWSVAPKARMTFPLWFSRAEQVARYHAVRGNLFARDGRVPDRLLTPSNAYRAYLLENALPGRSGDPAKSLGRMQATEGVISALFWRIVNDGTIQGNRAAPEFYAAFGAAAEAVDGLDNAYLKVFAAIRKGKYDGLAVARAHQALFPADAPAIERILGEVLLERAAPAAGELWLLNTSFEAGTSLFDQFRGMPVAQAFDLNAASPADLAAVRGLDRQTAAAILRTGTFASLEDLRRVPGMTEDAFARFQRMREAMLKPPSPGKEREGELSFRAILLPYLWRAMLVWLACAAVGALLYGSVRNVAWWRLVLNGLAAALAGLLAGWTIDPGTGLLALVTPVILFGMPGALFCLWRSRSPRRAGLVLAAWASATAAAALAVVPLG
jgi:hypothetical protein